MKCVPPQFYSECDVAALVYYHAEDPDALLAEFIFDLRRRGFEAVGVLQRRKLVQRDFGAPVELFLLPEKEDDSPTVEPNAAFDLADQFVTYTKKMMEVLDQQPDIMVLNRFGWREANGAGLLSVLSVAIERDVPVVIAVPESLFKRWLLVAQGLAVKLKCDRFSLDRWWSALRRSPFAKTSPMTCCERFK
jgi:hypothetical protein